MSRPGRRVYVPLFALLSLGVATVAAADPAIHIELNAAETMQQDHCLLSFVVQNSTESAIDTLKLDLAVFDREGAIRRRMIAEMGPLRAAKTIVRTFNAEADCDNGSSAVPSGGAGNGSTRLSNANAVTSRMADPSL